MKTKFDELKQKSFAVEYLGARLKDGTLSLFLGAGASSGFGLPDWQVLVNSIRVEIGLGEITDPKPSAEILQAAADEVATRLGNTETLIDLIQKYLYVKSHSISNVFDNHLLIAISAMLMGSKRGHVTKVITLNYDSMLEWFLSLYGFVVKSIYKLPELEGSEDVRIYHPHGFIPNPALGFKRSDFVILTRYSVFERLGAHHDPWLEMVRHMLDTSVCLFIGMSGRTLSDPALAPLFVTSGKKHMNTRPLGIWLLKGDLDPAKDAEFAASNIVPISVLDVKEIPEFILQICQEAAKK